MVIIMFTWKIAPFIGSGPLWGYAIKEFENQCGAEFFQYLFLVENFSENYCNSWLWLWEIDIQLCIFFTPLLLLYCSCKSRLSKLLFVAIQLVLLTSSMLLPPFYQQANNIHQFFEQIEFESINISPLSRVGAYMVGYNLGIIFFEFRTSKSIEQNIIIKLMSKKIVRVFIVLTSFFILALMAYYISSIDNDLLTFSQKIWFNSFHFLFPLTVCILITPPLFGFNSWFKIFL